MGNGGDVEGEAQGMRGHGEVFGGRMVGKGDAECASQ